MLEKAVDSNTVPFEPIAPRLYLAFSSEQLAWGNREFDVLSVNVRGMDVRAKKMDRNNIIHALRGYQSYFRHYGDDWTRNEPFHGLDYNLIPGKTIFQKHVRLDSSEDVSEKTALNWGRYSWDRKVRAYFSRSGKRA